MRMFRFINLFLMIAMSLMLTACGGGGGSSTTVDNKLYTIGSISSNGSFSLGNIGMTPTTIGSGGASLLTVAVRENSTTAYNGATVSFTSNCLSSNKATITTTTPTSGIYTAQYTNISCSGADTITATGIIGSKSITAEGTLTLSNSTNSAVKLGYHDGSSFHEGILSVSPNQITTNSNSILRANLWDAALNQAYTGTAVVTFSGDCQLTNSATVSTTTAQAQGVYTATYTDQGCSGTKAVRAQAVLADGTISATGSITMTNSTPATLTMGNCGNNIACTSSNFIANALHLSNSATLSAGGQVNIDGWLWDGSQIYSSITPITLTSACAASTPPKASLTTTSAQNGQFITTYKDLGCGGNDTVTASASVNGQNLQASVIVPVAADAVGSITFADATPNTMGLKGTGLNEQSSVRFLVKGGGTGLPIPNTSVSFTLSSQAGGITFGNGSTTTSALTDTNGYATIIVRSGTTPTPVRVMASVNGLATQSDQLVISTTLPDQVHFSLSTDKYSPEGLSYDGEPITVTARLADQFGNLVPDGTTVYFTTEGGSIQSTCNIISGACSVTWTSQDPRPPAIDTNNAGRATILAYALGVESFIDNDNNNIFSTGDSFGSSVYTDSTYQRRDMEAPYRDDNFDFTPQLTEFRPALLPGGSFAADTEYNGVICTATGPIVCSSQKNIYVFRNMQIAMSGSHMQTIGVFSLDGGASYINTALTPTTAITNGSPISINLRDSNNNTLPTGSQVTVTYSPSNASIARNAATLTGVTSDTITSGGNLDPRIITVNIAHDATLGQGTGTIAVEVTTPKGNKSSAQLSVKID
jgi:hypothetical protein